MTVRPSVRSLVRPVLRHRPYLSTQWLQGFSNKKNPRHSGSRARVSRDVKIAPRPRGKYLVRKVNPLATPRRELSKQSFHVSTYIILKEHGYTCLALLTVILIAITYSHFAVKLPYSRDRCLIICTLIFCGLIPMSTSQSLARYRVKNFN